MYRTYDYLRGTGLGASWIETLVAQARAKQMAAGTIAPTTSTRPVVLATTLPVLTPISTPSPIPTVPTPTAATPIAMMPPTSAPMMVPAPGASSYAPAEDAAESTTQAVATAPAGPAGLPIIPIAIALAALFLFTRK